MASITHLSPFPYLESLLEISGFRLTPQQANVLSCYVSGRSVLTTAALLDIGPRAVETHTRDIRKTLNIIEYGGRQKIIRFAENSGKYEELKEHYLHLLKWSDFIKSLKEIKTILPEEKQWNVTFTHPPYLRIFLKKMFDSLEVKYRIAQNNPHVHFTNSGGINFNGELFSFYDGIFAFLKHLYPKQDIESFEGQFIHNKNYIDVNEFSHLGIVARKVILLPKTGVVNPLPRQPLHDQIKEKFNGDGIRIICLSGIGGSGKSTLAQNYAAQSDADVICYINAESKESIYRSFRQLAYELIQNFSESFSLRTIMYELKLELRKRSGKWLLVYDNVKSFEDLESNFPFSVFEWGEGEVILTTRNENLLNKINLSNTKYIYLGELAQEERHNLFINIHGETKLENLDTLLTIIPPFPLDVSTAAYYLKENKHINCINYIDLINAPNEDFIDFQDEIFLSHSPYGHTRYKIAETSLEDITKKNGENMLLLLFISLLYPGGISKHILYALDNNFVKVDRLIFSLKNSGLAKECIDSISFHSIVHAAISLFVKKKISPQDCQNNFEKFTNTFQKLKNKVRDEDNRWEAYKLIEYLEYFLKKIKIPKEISPIHYTSNKNKLVKFFNYFFPTIQGRKVDKTEIPESRGIRNDQAEIIVLSIRLNTYLAQLHSYLLNFNESLKYRETAWASCNSLHGKYDYHTLNTLFSLGHAWETCGSFSKAREIYEECLEISNQINGMSHELSKSIVFSLEFVKKTLINKIDSKYFNNAYDPERLKKIFDVLADKKGIANKLFDKYLEVSVKDIKEIFEKKLEIKLTFREIEALCSVGLGLTIRQVAYLTQISPKTLEMHLRNLKIKFGLNNRLDLIDILYKNDLFDIALLFIEKIAKDFEFRTHLKNFSQEYEMKLKLYMLYMPKINHIDDTLNKIKGHLMLAGIRFDEETSDECDLPIYIVGKPYQSINHINCRKEPIYLQLHADQATNDLSLDSPNIIDFSDKKLYTSSFLELLRLLRAKLMNEEKAG